MDVKTVRPTDRVNFQQPLTSASTAGASSDVLPEVQVKQGQIDISQAGIEPEKTPEQMNKDELLPITKELNKFMTYLNADIQFELHEKMQRLIVKVVDVKENKVLREFPPHELLDKMANIREYIGVLLDKKA